VHPIAIHPGGHEVVCGSLLLVQWHAFGLNPYGQPVECETGLCNHSDCTKLAMFHLLVRHFSSVGHGFHKQMGNFLWGMNNSIAYCRRDIQIISREGVCIAERYISA
jgi:hypothetical protein